MLCFFVAYFSYLLTGSYYYYEKFNDRSLFGWENFVELHWLLFSSLAYVCLIGTSVAITKEVTQ